MGWKAQQWLWKPESQESKVWEGCPKGPKARGWGWGEAGKARSLPSADIRLDQSRPIGASSAPGAWRQTKSVMEHREKDVGQGEGREGRQE